jgi:hypothetical protein
MAGMAMPGQIKGNDAQALEPGCQTREAVGVVEPAVQSNHRLPILGAV